jgi:hypothetical protein
MVLANARKSFMDIPRVFADEIPNLAIPAIFAGFFLDKR